MWRLPARLPITRRRWTLWLAGNFITIKLNAHPQLAPWRIRCLDANHVARAQPFVCGLAGNLFRHLQKDLDGVTDAQRRIRREVNTSLGEVHRFGPLLCNRRLQNANPQRQPEVVTSRDTAV